MLHDLFARPELLPLLLVLPLLWQILRRLDARRGLRLQDAVGPRAPHLAHDLSPRRRAWRRRLAFLAFALVLVALLEPTWGEVAALELRGRDIAVAIDVSRSMLARDVAPDRLARALAEVRRLAALRAGDRMALVAFAGEARVLAPLTADGDSLVELLERCDPLAVERGGTDVATAVEASLALLEAAEGEARSILVLTDGEDHEGRGAAAAAVAREQGVLVHAFGLGSALGAKIPLGDARGYLRDESGREVVSRLEPASLERLAAAGGGRFLAAADHDLGELLALEEPRREGPRVRGEERRPRGRHRHFLIAAFLLLVVELGLTDRRRA